MFLRPSDRSGAHCSLLPEGSAGKCRIVILHFEKLQKTPDTSQEFMNTMQIAMLRFISGSMPIFTPIIVCERSNASPGRMVHVQSHGQRCNKGVNEDVGSEHSL